MTLHKPYGAESSFSFMNSAVCSTGGRTNYACCARCATRDCHDLLLVASWSERADRFVDTSFGPDCLGILHRVVILSLELSAVAFLVHSGVLMGLET